MHSESETLHINSAQRREREDCKRCVVDSTSLLPGDDVCNTNVEDGVALSPFLSLFLCSYW